MGQTDSRLEPINYGYAGMALSLPQVVDNICRTVNTHGGKEDGLDATMRDVAGLEKEYLRHIRSSDEAQNALSELVCRLNDGEDVTLVCYEKPSEPCHRHLLIELIESRLSSKFFNKNRDSPLTA